MQSRSLTWITSQSIADKYTGFFTTARSQLQSGDTSAAHTTLESVLQNASQDSASTLTSEAYALLRFNTEYLMSHLGSGQAPEPPTLRSPSNGATAVALNPTLVWSISPGAASYRVQLSTSSSFATTIVNQSGTTDTTYAVSGLSGNTTYYWRVNATNSAGTSGWSTTFSFTTATGGGGGTNILVNPGFENGEEPWSFFTNGDGSFEASSPGYTGSLAGKISITQAGSNVQLREYDLTLDPNTLYRLSFAAKSNNGHDVDVSVFQNGSPYTNYGLDPYSFDLTNTWSTYSVEFTTQNFSTTVNDARLMLWLAPYATAGDEYSFDDVILARVTGGTIPPAPTLSSPSNAATGVSTSPTLAWGASTGATSYQLQVSASSGFGTTVVSQSGITGTSYAASGLSNNTTYYWHVNATNSAGTSAYSTAFSFTTATGGVGGTNILTNPGFENGEEPWSFFTNGDGSFETSSPGYTGSSAGKVTITQAGSNVQLREYDLTLDPSTLYRLSFAAKCNTGHDVEVSLFQNGSPYTNYGLSGYDFDLTSTWSTYSVEFTTENFSTTVHDGRLMFWLAPYATASDEYWLDDIVLAKVTGGTIPPAPTLSSPANADTGVSTSPTLTWGASTGATSYQLQVSTSSGFGTTVVNQSGITGTSYAVSSLSNSTTYYWRVNATNSTGTSAYSSTFSFTTGSGGSGGTNLIANGDFESGTDSWNWYTNGTGDFTTGTPAYEGGSSAIFSVTTTGSNMQINQTGFELEANTSYRLEFAASCTGSHPLHIYLHKNTSPYTLYGIDEEVSLGTSWSTHVINFTTEGFSGTTTDTRLRFWFVDLAENGDTYRFDAVKLSKVQ